MVQRSVWWWITVWSDEENQTFSDTIRAAFLIQVNINNSVLWENLSFRKLLRKTSKYFTLRNRNTLSHDKPKMSLCFMYISVFSYLFHKFLFYMHFFIISIWKQYFFQYTKSLINTRRRIKLWRANTWTSEV